MPNILKFDNVNSDNVKYKLCAYWLQYIGKISKTMWIKREMS